jgi:hypothetical protein
MKKLVLFFLIIISVSLLPQNDTSKSKEDDLGISSLVKSWIKISGEAGTYGELYSMSGITSRRPSSTGRIYVRPVITLFESFNIGFDLFLSTEGNSAKQQMDQIGIHPSWSWGQAHLVDFSHEFSRYTLSGIQIRGAGIEINPGIFRLHLVGGQTQRAVKTSPFESVYSRYLFGVKIGIGKKESSFLDFNIVKSKDDASSISRKHFMSVVKDSVLHGGSYVQKTDTIYTGVTPQENLVLGTNFVLKLFGGMIQLQGEAAGSAYTKDLYSQEVKADEIPDIINKVFKAKYSTTADYVYQGEIRFHERMINARLGYRTIGPGYTSMGLSSTINDKRIFDGALGLNLLQGQLMIQTSYSRQRDNLIKQKLFTSTRNEFNTTTSIRPLKEAMISVNFVYSSFENDAKNDTFKLHNVNNAYNFSGTYQFGMFDMNHIFITTYSYQTYKDQNILRRGNEVNAQNVMINLTTIIGKLWNVSTGVQLNTVTIQSSSKSTFGLSARVNSRAFSENLNNSLGYSFNSSSSSNSHNIQFQSMYSFNQANSITFNIRSTIFEGKPPTAYRFFENIASLGYIYRF